MLDIADLMQTDGRPRRGRQHPRRRQADDAADLRHLPALAAGELFEQLPEAGDLENPSWCSSSTRRTCCSTRRRPAEKIEQVVRLIRSKGVGIYFVTQNPLDVPDKVLAQLGNRVQHALRAFTPRDQKAVQTAAQTRAPIPKFDAEEAIMELGVGEALISFLDEGHAAGGRTRLRAGARFAHRPADAGVAAFRARRSTAITSRASTNRPRNSRAGTMGATAARKSVAAAAGSFRTRNPPAACSAAWAAHHRASSNQRRKARRGPWARRSAADHPRRAQFHSRQAQALNTGVWLAVFAALGFSAKAIFVKLAYAAAPVEAVTLLALRAGVFHCRCSSGSACADRATRRH